jgi:hypothetical protein
MHKSFLPNVTRGEEECEGEDDLDVEAGITTEQKRGVLDDPPTSVEREWYW